MGLFLQTAAYAAGPEMAVPTVQSQEMDANCMEKMQHSPDKKPCNDLTLKCIATMGCVAPVGLPGIDALILTNQPAASPMYWAAAPTLIGENPAPEHHPPTFLG